MSRLGSAVNVVTTVSGGQRYGFTASAVCSVNDTPATLLVCMNRASSCFHAFEDAGYFWVNTGRQQNGGSAALLSGPKS